MTKVILLHLLIAVDLRSGQAASNPPSELTEQAQHFSSYETARTVLQQAMRSARYRVLLVSQKITDGDIATVLHSLSIRDIFVQVMLDRRHIRLYNSRHTYLQRAEIPVYLATLKTLENPIQSFLVIDNTVLLISSTFDPAWKGPVTVGPAPLHAGEIVSLFSSVPLLKPLPQGAKSPTRIESAFPRKSDTIRLRASSLPKKGTGPLPRKLPKATRLEEIGAGRAPGDEQIRPVRGLQDGVLRLDNESELAED